MRVIKHVYTEEYGEIEGMFDEGDHLISAWSCNDATWRNEYFDEFIKELGAKVITSDDPKLVKKLIKYFK
jgi:hypothetical protein